MHDGRPTGCNIAYINRAPEYIDAEILPRRSGNACRIRANQRLFRPGIFCRSKLQTARLNIARFRLLDDILPAQSRLAGSVLNHPIQINILATALDIDSAAVRISVEADSNIVIRLHRILRNIRVTRLLHQRILIFFRKPNRIPETLRALLKRYRRHIPYILSLGNFIRLTCPRNRASIIHPI